jgi:hypothetical protein
VAKLLSEDRKLGIDKDGKVVPKVVPAVNQIELHPYARSQFFSSVSGLSKYIHVGLCVQQEIVDYCANRGIVLTAYFPLGSDRSPLLKNPIVVKLVDKHNVQPANILISICCAMLDAGALSLVAFVNTDFLPSKLMVPGRKGKEKETGSGCTRNAVDGYYHPPGLIPLSVIQAEASMLSVLMHDAAFRKTWHDKLDIRRRLCCSWTLCLETLGRGMIYMRGLVPFSEGFWMDNRNADMEATVTLLRPIIYVYILMHVAREL